nr:ribonuclease H-like domain, reverse transcriptase, RNA-dependent DNA polymerase [Tanacetum cinerariifolium]
KPRKPTRKDSHVPQPSGHTESVADEAVYKELGNRLVRAAATASSLEAEQDSGNITKTQSKATPNEPSLQGTDSDFVVYQMGVKRAFRYGKIEKEAYVCQPPGFEDLDFPDRVYKELCITFEKLMHEKFQLSAMGELTFFLGLQVKQKKDGIFISQDKYIAEIKKNRFTEVKTVSTPIETQKPLLKDEDGKEVDVYMYRSMIGSLMYLTSSRPNIMFALCTCARY